jgi:hypothetical protein
MHVLFAGFIKLWSCQSGVVFVRFTFAQQSRCALPTIVHPDLWVTIGCIDRALSPVIQAPGSTGFPPGQPQGLGADPFAFATNTLAGQVLQQSSASYLQKGQAYVQSTIGLLSGGVVHYHFSVDSAYIRAKLLMLIAPFLKRWSWTRVLEQVWGPRHDSFEVLGADG